MELLGEDLINRELEVANRKVSVFNLRGKYNEEEFTRLFVKFGEIEVAYFLNYDDRTNKFFGFVTYKNAQFA